MNLKEYISKFNELRRGYFAQLQPGRVLFSKIPCLGKRNIIYVETGGTLEIRGTLKTCRDVEIIVYKRGHLIIEDNVYIGHGSTIACVQNIFIGKDTMIADFVTIRDMNHRRQPGVPLCQSGMDASAIRIGNNCLMGSKVTVVAGAQIGNEVTVGANAVVKGAFGNGCTIGGIPAKVLH
jgi:acetyltransferase-like isoleucine patch superfamily enzyme